MDNYIGKDGVITCPTEMGIMIKSVQSDITDPTATDILITMSGSFGTRYVLNAVSPVVGNLTFLYNEDVNITTAGSTLNNVIINYIKYGTQDNYMETSPDRVHRPLIGKWKL